MEFESIQLITARILRDNQGLRTIDKREEVVNMVRKTRPGTSYESVVRCIRKLQNQKGLYLPDRGDDRYVNADQYREYFKEV